MGIEIRKSMFYARLPIRAVSKTKSNTKERTKVTGGNFLTWDAVKSEKEAKNLILRWAGLLNHFRLCVQKIRWWDPPKKKGGARDTLEGLQKLYFRQPSIPHRGKK